MSLAASHADNQKGSTAAASAPSPDMAQLFQMEENVATAAQQASQEIEAIKQKLQGARGAERRKLQAALDTTQNRLDVLQAGSSTLRQLRDFMHTFGEHETGDLPSSIDGLARTVPDVIGPAAGESQRQTSDFPSVSKPRDSGILVLISEVSALGQKLSILDDEMRVTDKLRQSSDNLRNPLLASINKERLLAGTNIDLQASDLHILQQEQARLDELAVLVKALSPAIVALDKQKVLFTAYVSHLKSWRAAVLSEDKQAWKGLILRLVGTAVVIGALIVITTLARRFTDTHVRDAERRHVFRVFERIGLGFTMALVVSFSFASDLSSLATFLGLLTAGLAVALQSVILSGLGYFLLVGRRGIKLGDRVQISGVTGDVIDIGWLQFQLREIDNKTQQPTGHVVTFSNSFVLASPATGLSQFNYENSKQSQLEVTEQRSRS